MSKKSEARDVLVAVLRRKSSLEILKKEGWYHIPVEAKIKNWPPTILAFYQGYRFGEAGFSVRYFGEVDQHIEILRRKELFPNDNRNEAKGENLYYRLRLRKLQEREKPILVYRPRVWAFISTTMSKFKSAEQLNDLFVGSRLEERLWKALKYINVLAEREWKVWIRDHAYYIDFAVFCKNGKLAIETDGYTTHYDSKERIDYDTWRQNEIALDEWDLLRYTSKQVREDWTGYLTQIQTKIDQLGGPESPEAFNRKLGEERMEYDTDDDDLF